MDVLVLQHIACEPPGVYEDVLRERGAGITRVELDEGEPLPQRGFDAIVAMGGPMSVNDEDEHPWLAEEKRIIGDAVRAGTPFWGACLGVQLLAAALGARVYPGSAPEVGLLPIALTDEGRADPVTGVLPAEVLTLQWHGDTFDLPEGATLLASSPEYPNQAIRFRDAYGVQFHLEVSPAMAGEWSRVPEYGAYADGVLGPGALPGLLVEVGANAEEMRDHGRRMFETWLDTTVALRV
ncbi:MAG TPA: type 1 glutamine amidotransferase [Actinomycetota bacterium]|nr:type 1 glutamine amidotransferase [Actinomycetota bacterium]